MVFVSLAAFRWCIQIAGLYDLGRVYLREMRNLHVSKLAAAPDCVWIAFLLKYQKKVGVSDEISRVFLHALI